jgi:hypothetical protein
VHGTHLCVQVCAHCHTHLFSPHGWRADPVQVGGHPSACPRVDDGDTHPTTSGGRCPIRAATTQHTSGDVCVLVCVCVFCLSALRVGVGGRRPQQQRRAASPRRPDAPSATHQITSQSRCERISRIHRLPGSSPPLPSFLPDGRRCVARGGDGAARHRGR